MTSLYRLLHYSRAYRGRLVGAGLAMAVYGAGTAGVATLIRPIFDEVLPTQQQPAADRPLRSWRSISSKVWGRTCRRF